jgi:hypothetical protein
MRNPDKLTTTINVKGMSIEAWERAQICSQKQEQTRGVWLTRAVNHLAEIEEAAETGMAPAKPGNTPAKSGAIQAHPARMETAELQALMQSMAALAQATGIRPALAEIRRCYAAVDDRIRQDRGLAPRPIRTAPKPGIANGKTVTSVREPEIKLVGGTDAAL